MKNEKKIQGIKLDYICENESCSESHLKITIIFEGGSQVYNLDITEIPKLISNLTNMDNVHMMKTFAGKLDEFKGKDEVLDILDSWNNKDGAEK